MTHENLNIQTTQESDHEHDFDHEGFIFSWLSNKWHEVFKCKFCRERKKDRIEYDEPILFHQWYDW